MPISRNDGPSLADIIGTLGESGSLTVQPYQSRAMELMRRQPGNRPFSIGGTVRGMPLPAIGIEPLDAERIVVMDLETLGPRAEEETVQGEVRYVPRANVNITFQANMVQASAELERLRNYLDERIQAGVQGPERPDLVRSIHYPPVETVAEGTTTTGTTMVRGMTVDDLTQAVRSLIDSDRAPLYSWGEGPRDLHNYRYHAGNEVQHEGRLYRNVTVEPLRIIDESVMIEPSVQRQMMEALAANAVRSMDFEAAAHAAIPDSDDLDLSDFDDDRETVDFRAVSRHEPSAAEQEAAWLASQNQNERDVRANQNGRRPVRNYKYHAAVGPNWTPNKWEA
jgi:hypothetical protein